MKRQSDNTVAQKRRANRAPAKKSTRAADREGDSALARGIRVLRAFRAGDSVLTNRELAKRTNLPKPTISRIVATLTELGCLNYIEHMEAYKLGGALIAMGHVASANFDLLQVARPLMTRLAEEIGLAVGIGMLEKDRMVYMEACQGSARVALQMRVGSRLPLFPTAMGRAILATMPSDKRAALIDKYGPQDPEERKYTERAIERAAAELNRNGFCTITGEWDPNINGLAAPLLTGEGNFVLDCGGPSYLLPPNRMQEEIGPQLAKIAKKIRESMGIPPSGS
jgi:DNA-binding IclR family transcriptional regulator